MAMNNEGENGRCFDITHLGKGLLGLSLTGGGLGLLIHGSLTLVGGLLLRSFASGFSSVKQIYHIILHHHIFVNDIIQ